MRVFPRVLRYMAAVGVSVLLTASVAAQGITGTITGTLKDAQAGVIPGPTIAAEVPGAGLTRSNVWTAVASGSRNAALSSVTSSGSGSSDVVDTTTSSASTPARVRPMWCQS